MEKRAVEIGNRLIFPYTPVKIDVVGSVARGDEDPKDIDYLITVKDVSSNYLRKVEIKDPFKITQWDNCGTYNCYFKVKNTNYPHKRPILVNLFLTDTDSYIYAKLGRLYSKGDNICLRKKARQKGYTLNNYGLFSIETNRPIDRKFKRLSSLISFLKE